MTFTKTPYVPSFLRAALSGSRPIQLTFSQIVDTNIQNTSSFIYDAIGTPLKSTQQLHTDWSNFKNHTFFMSAETKVNVAFDQIINGYPFDGTRIEIEQFFEKLTGFDKWVFDNFPTYKGQLHFSGTQIGEDVDGTLGTWISVKDHPGALFPELSKIATDQSILNPNNVKSLTIEMQLFLPKIATAGTQVICQKMSGTTQGFVAYLAPTTSSALADLHFDVISGSTQLSINADVSKGVFNHIAFVLDRELGTHFLRFYNNNELITESKKSVVINDLTIDASDLTIATGSTFVSNAVTIVPTQTLSGTLDEFRIFHSVRSPVQLQQYARKSIFATPELRLYYRFNEPQPPLSTDNTDPINAIVIDSSGNSLHALINNFFNFVGTDLAGNITSSFLRQDAALDSLSNMIFEQAETIPILFPAHSGVLALNTELLASASIYDSENPNLITRLIPSHYLLEGAAFEGYEEPEGLSGKAYSGTGIPGQGQIGGVQILLSLLYVYAKFFDEVKLFIDSFSSLQYVSYDRVDNVPDNFILHLIKQYGFHLPPFFNDSTLEQYIRAENIDRDDSISTYSLRYVQNELLRRVMINLPDILRSKGTQHAIKSFLRAVGIDPENSMRVREYGGPSQQQLQFSREIKREPGMMLEFSTGSLVVSPHLSSSRTEPGNPEIAGNFVLSDTYTPNGISNDPNDGLLTSGSWTVESIVKWTPIMLRNITSATQSLCRLHVTGSNTSLGGIVANLVALSSSNGTSKLILHLRPGNDALSPYACVELPLTGCSVFDSDRWNISFGVERNDAINSRVSSSYFVRVAKQSEGVIEKYAATSSFVYELADQPGEINAFRSFDSVSNVSGTFISLGQNHSPIVGSGLGYLYLNDTSTVPQEAQAVAFTGLVSNLRFWSKALTKDEWCEHVRNFKSFGVRDPLVNYNFVHTRSGSFERLRLDSLSKQSERQADATSSIGSITLIDYSQNNYHLTGTGFPIERNVLRGELFDYSYLSPNFDEAVTSDKIRARSFANQALVDEISYVQVAPIHEIVKSEEPTDNVKFSVEYSLVDALNRDIINIFATLDAIDNAIGNPELLFSPDYPDLDRLRNIYFNRMQDKLNFKAFFEFLRWFDTSIGSFIEQLVPRKTDFKGTNFMIESHVLERHKLEYFGSEIYLGEEDRSRIRDVLLLQQITGVMRKF